MSHAQRGLADNFENDPRLDREAFREIIELLRELGISSRQLMAIGRIRDRVPSFWGVADGHRRRYFDITEHRTASFVETLGKIIFRKWFATSHSVTLVIETR